MFFLYVLQKKISIFLGVEIILFAILVFVTLTFLHGTKKRSMLVGILAVIMNVAMYASPLTVMVLLISPFKIYVTLLNLCYIHLQYKSYVASSDQHQECEVHAILPLTCKLLQWRYLVRLCIPQI